MSMIPMAGQAFESLSTEQFRLKMRPHAVAIYNQLFPKCRIDDLRENGLRVHILDKEFGIDTLATMQSGQWVSIQEKYRTYDYLTKPHLQIDPPTPDFTKEYKNAEGTPFEQPGEWFKLGAQLYFYGWANESQTAFAKWVLLDIAKYKLHVEQSGGLATLGRLMKNNKHGKATFYAIPITRLKPAWIATYSNPIISP